MIQSRNGWWLCRIREDDTSKWFFWFAVSSCGIHSLSFLTLPIYFKCQMTVEWGMLSCLATSCVAVRGSALMILSHGRQLYSSSSRLSFSLQNFLNHHYTVLFFFFLAIPGPTALLILWVISAALPLILNLNKKITRICFLSNINSTV